MNPIKQFFSNPLVGIIGSIASVIGLIVGFYFYFASIKQPLFNYQVKSTRTTIVKASDTNGFKVSFGGKEIQGDISAVQIGIWNKGKQTIKPENMRKRPKIDPLPLRA